MPAERAVSSPVLFAILAAIYLALAWPGAGERGVIAEEATPYLRHYPRVLAGADERGVALLPPHDRPAGVGLVATSQWPNVAYQGEDRVWPLFIKGHQSALGTYVGIAAGPLLGDGIAGIRRSSVLLGLALLALVFVLGRRLGLSRPSAALAVLACSLSPGLLFFSRTGYGFELASRVAMLGVLVLAAPARPLTRARGLALGLALAAALLCRATIAATLLPALLLLLAHPARRSGPLRPLAALALGAALPVLAVLAVQASVTFHAGTAPAAKLPLADLAPRTGTAPAHLAAQLTWVADPGAVLLPLITNNDDAAALLPLLFGTGVFLLALVRWWRARASDGECLFVAAALGNALSGAWLYGDPQQFQLGMALEPLFVLALAGQLGSLRSRRLAAALVGLALAARAWQGAALLHAERRTANPMLSGAAQRALVAALVEASPPDGGVITTTYNHVGVIETWTAGQIAPVHAYRVLRRRRAADPVAAWRAILRAYPVRFVVLTTGRNVFEGPFTDNEGAHEALRGALQAEGRPLLRRRDLACESGDPCLSLWELGPPTAQ